MTAKIFLAILFLGAAPGTLPASAQTPGGGDPLMAICSGFLEQNSLQVSGNSGRLCTCLVREVKGQLSRAEMETYDRLNAQSRPLPPALQAKITNIAVQCLTEAQ